jgi:hypothetical protein
MTPLNACAECGEDFASLAAFDAHILSKPAEPVFDCMQELELKLKSGWIKDARGHRTTPKLVARADSLRKAA